MVIVRLFGGLGNQMFQYAAGRRLAYAHNTSLRLDLSALKNYSLREYYLHHFNIIEDFASSTDLERFKKKGIRGISEFFKPYYKRSVIRQKFFTFDPNILKAGPEVYLDGYWQSEEYFRDIEDIIRKEFSLKTALDAVNEALLEQINNFESVSLHIRRGDYVKDSVTNSEYGTCPLGYYYDAISQLSEISYSLHFFIFSDDIGWVRENLKIDYPATFVSHNSLKDCYADLWLMSHCKYHIIANSTFSWWSAWLCKRQRKIVFAPFKWFDKKRRNIKDLIPSAWRLVRW